MMAKLPVFNEICVHLFSIKQDATVGTIIRVARIAGRSPPIAVMAMGRKIPDAVFHSDSLAIHGQFPSLRKG